MSQLAHEKIDSLRAPEAPRLELAEAKLAPVAALQASHECSIHAAVMKALSERRSISEEEAFSRAVLPGIASQLLAEDYLRTLNYHPSYGEKAVRLHIPTGRFNLEYRSEGPTEFPVSLIGVETITDSPWKSEIEKRNHCYRWFHCNEDLQQLVQNTAQHAELDFLDNLSCAGALPILSAGTRTWSSLARYKADVDLSKFDEASMGQALSFILSELHPVSRPVFYYEVPVKSIRSRIDRYWLTAQPGSGIPDLASLGDTRRGIEWFYAKERMLVESVRHLITEPVQALGSLASRIGLKVIDFLEDRDPRYYIMSSAEAPHHPGKPLGIVLRAQTKEDASFDYQLQWWMHDNKGLPKEVAAAI